MNFFCKIFLIVIIFLCVCAASLHKIIIVKTYLSIIRILFFYEKVQCYLGNHYILAILSRKLYKTKSINFANSVRARNHMKGSQRQFNLWKRKMILRETSMKVEESTRKSRNALFTLTLQYNSIIFDLNCLGKWRK